MPTEGEAEAEGEREGLADADGESEGLAEALGLTPSTTLNTCAKPSSPEPA